MGAGKVPLRPISATLKTSRQALFVLFLEKRSSMLVFPGPPYSKTLTADTTYPEPTLLLTSGCTFSFV